MGTVIRVADGVADLHQVSVVFDRIWGMTMPLVRVEVLRAVQHAGGYVSIAERDGDVVGGSFGFLGRHGGEPTLHSHVTGVLPDVRGTGLGRALKLHQRAWAAEHGLAAITWTFDPLVRRNAWFNLHVLGARVEEYLVDFYGPIDDSVNARDESDRLLVVWDVHESAAGASAPHNVAIRTPDDIVELRQTDPSAAAEWRRRLRTELGGLVDAGAVVVGFTRDGDYLVHI